MELTKKQLRSLSLANSYRDSPPTLLDLVKINFSSLFISIVVFGGIAVIFFFVNLEFVGLFLIGYLFGILRRDFQAITGSIRFWHVAKEITNWQRLDEILNENKTT